jgi:trigger factor
MSETKITKLSSKGLLREFNAVVPEDQVKLELETKLHSISSEVKIPGFRPGKVPLPVLKSKFAKSVMGEVLEKIVNNTIKKIIENNKLDVVTQPKVKVESYEEGKDLSCKISIEISPDIPEIDFSKMSFNRYSAAVTDGDLEHTLKDLASKHKRFERIKAPRKAKMGDTIIFDYDATCEGKTFPGGSGKNEEIELGSGRYIPGYEDQMVGVEENKDSEVNITFPADYRSSEIAGKKAVFKIHIKEIKEPIKIDIDDKLAQDFGSQNMQAFREKVRADLVNQNNSFAVTILKRDIMDSLVKKYNLPLPQGMVNDTLDGLKKQESQEPAAAGDKKKEKKEDKSKNDRLLKKAQRMVLLNIILSRFAKKHNISVSEEELTSAIESQARSQFPGQEKMFIDQYRQNPEALSAMRGKILEAKVLDKIVSEVKIDDKSISVAELGKIMKTLDTGNIKQHDNH